MKVFGNRIFVLKGVRNKNDHTVLKNITEITYKQDTCK